MTSKEWVGTDPFTDGEGLRMSNARLMTRGWSIAGAYAVAGLVAHTALGPQTAFGPQTALAAQATTAAATGVRVERLLDAPIITPDLHPSIGENIQGPSVIRVPDWVQDPLGAYYLYFADHKGTYIREGADAPLEPSVRSTAYGHVNQLRDPVIFEDAESGRVFLLYAVAGESGIAVAEVASGSIDDRPCAPCCRSMTHGSEGATLSRLRTHARSYSRA